MDPMVLTAYRLRNWVVVDFSAKIGIKELVRNLRDEGKGRVIEDPVIINEDKRSAGDNPANRVKKMWNRQKLKQLPQFILCALQSADDDLMIAHWMKTCLVDKGVAAHLVFTGDHLPEVPCGIDRKLRVREESVPIEGPARLIMMVGATVIHETQAQASIISVVGSQWPMVFSRYRAILRKQPKMDEDIIATFHKPLADGKDDGIFRNLLDHCDLGTPPGSPPDIIILFRPVNESHFDKVLNTEVDQILKACSNYDPAPKLIVIAVQRGHRTLLIPAEDGECIPAGTLVDNEVVHHKYFDFFMCSSSGNKERFSEPARCTILWNDSEEHLSMIASIIQTLCHHCPQCPLASFSSPDVAPLAYANRAGRLMSKILCSYPNPGEELPQLHDSIAGTMFF